jgi:predicted nucleic acid-binding protein
MLYDTEYLISFAGGAGVAAQKRAVAFFNAQTHGHRYTSRVCWMEYAAGCDSPDPVARDLRRFQVLEFTEAIAWRASRIDRQLRGEHIGDNDVWIAATALVYGLPVVTNNVKHLGRVKGLRLLGY